MMGTSNRSRLQRVLFLALQGFTLLVGVWTLYVALTYRPYILCGNLICSFQDEYYEVPPIPESGDSVQFDAPLFFFQVALIVWMTAMIVLLLRPRAVKRSIGIQAAICAAGIVVLQGILMATACTGTWL